MNFVGADNICRDIIAEGIDPILPMLGNLDEPSGVAGHESGDHSTAPDPQSGC